MDHAKYKPYFKFLVDEMAANAANDSSNDGKKKPTVVQIIPPREKQKPMTFNKRLANLRRPVTRPYNDGDLNTWLPDGTIDTLSVLGVPPVTRLVLGDMSANHVSTWTPANETPVSDNRSNASSRRRTVDGLDMIMVDDTTQPFRQRTRRQSDIGTQSIQRDPDADPIMTVEEFSASLTRTGRPPHR